MPSLVGETGLWIRRNLIEIAAAVSILTGVGSFISDLNPLIWQGMILFLLILGAYEIGYRRGERSSEISRQEKNVAPERVRGLIETDEGLIARAIEGIDGWFVIREGGDIVLQPETDLNPDREGMLYVFAARAAYDAGERDSPRVSQEELANETRLSGGATTVFLRMMGEFINRHHDQDQQLREIDNENVEIELNLSEVMEAVEYIRGKREAPN